MATGMIVFSFTGYFLSSFIFSFSKVSYNRVPLTKFLGQKFARIQMQDAATDDAMIIGYEYNKQKPRFYTKQLANYKDEFKVSMSEAIVGACSLLDYFLPYQL